MLGNLFLSIFYIIIVSVAYCFLLAKLKNRVSLFRTWILLPTTIISGFILYFIGYATHPDEEMVSVQIFKAIHSTVKMIILETDINEVSEIVQDNRLYMICISISHFLAIMLAVTTAFGLFGRKLNSKLRILTSFRRKCYIIFGTSDEAITLATDILKNDPNRDLFFVEDSSEFDNDSELFDKIESLGAFFIDNNNTTNRIGGSILFNHIINSDSTLIYVSSDENKNISAVLHLFSLLKELPPQKRKCAEQNTSVCLQIDTEDMIQVFEEARNDMGIMIEYSIFNVPEIIATQLIREYNPLKYVSIDSTRGIATEDYELLIIGFGINGRNILRQIIEFGQFVGSNFRATVVDKTITTKIGSFAANYPAIMSNYSIDSIQDCVGSATFFSLIERLSPRLKQIIISLDSDTLNVKTAIEISKLHQTLNIEHNIDIIIITRQSDNYLYLHNSNKFKSIHCVGQNRDIFTESIIINESLLSEAKAVHEHYNSTKSPERRKLWGELESIKRQSNAAATLHTPTKIALLGLTKEQILKMSYDEYIDYIRTNQSRYENLARTEHLRWNATHFTRGWQVWPLSKLPDHSTSQDHTHRLHACLVSWEELDAVEEHFNGEPYKRYDYDNIDAIYELAHSGLL